MRKLGEGLLGEVFEGRDTVSGTTVAIKASAARFASILRLFGTRGAHQRLDPARDPARSAYASLG